MCTWRVPMNRAYRRFSTLYHQRAAQVPSLQSLYMVVSVALLDVMLSIFRPKSCFIKRQVVLRNRTAVPCRSSQCGALPVSFRLYFALLRALGLSYGGASARSRCSLLSMFVMLRYTR